MNPFGCFNFRVQVLCMVAYCHTIVVYRDISCCAPQSWNKLPEDIRLAPNLTSFESSCKEMELLNLITN